MELKPLIVLGSIALATASIVSCSSNSTTDDAANGHECVEATDAELDALFTEWNDALQSGDPSKVAALYREDAVLLPTLSVPIAKTPAEITDYFKNLMEADPVARMDESHKYSGCNLAYNAGRWTINANGEDVHARVTWVYRYDDGKWMLAQHHSSVDPG
jgi:hypothetical protein